MGACRSADPFSTSRLGRQSNPHFFRLPPSDFRLSKVISLNATPLGQGVKDCPERAPREWHDPRMIHMTEDRKPKSLPIEWVGCMKMNDPHATHETYLAIRETPDRMMDKYYVQMAIYRFEQNPPTWEYFQADYTNSLDDAFFKMVRRSPIKHMMKD